MKSSFKSKKCQAKIRMFSNAGLTVNMNRAEMSSSLALRKSLSLSSPPIFTQEMLSSNTIDFEGGKPKSKGSSKAEIRESWNDVRVNVFIEYNPLVIDRVKKEKWEINRKGNIVIANLSFAELDLLLKSDNNRNDIVNIQLGQTLNVPRPVVRNSKLKKESKPKFIEHSNSKVEEDVLIGIIDVDGFDFSHPDFLDHKGETRFISIWDQGGKYRQPPKGSKFKYGSELTQNILNSAIENSSSFKVPAYELEPQSQMYNSSHGTHVASIAAGNSGVCPNSKIAAVLIDLRDEEYYENDEDYDRRKSFYDSTRVANAIDYLLKIANNLDLPISINISLGTNGHAHDGSAPICRWIDSELKIPGRSVCVAAGNSGQEKGESEDDLNFVMGRIHTSGKILANGLEKDIEWIVRGDGIVDVSENELEIWYSSQDRFAVSIKPPGKDWIGPIEPGEYIENQQLPDLSFISVYNELYNPSNGSNYLAIYLSPYLDDRKELKGIPSGTWRVRLFGRQIRDGSFHGWIERDNISRYRNSRAIKGSKWFFPSYFSENSNVDNTSISSLACANEVIGVANLDETQNQINITSSQGPTRDKRFKPDLAAPGTNILAANGFDYDNLWVEMTGTSMASPFVCGAIGLMLKEERNLTASQIVGILKCTARPLPGMDYNWDNSSGYGVIDIGACLDQARKVNDNIDITN